MTGNVVPYTSNVDPWTVEIDQQRLPYGFYMGPEGTFFQPDPTPKNPKPKRVAVCAAIVVVARVHDDKDLGWGRIFKFKNQFDRMQMCFISDQQIHDSAPSLVKELVHHGFHVETGKYPSLYLKQLLNSLEADEHIYAKQAGWQKDINGRE